MFTVSEYSRRIYCNFHVLSNDLIYILSQFTVTADHKGRVMEGP